MSLINTSTIDYPNDASISLFKSSVRSLVSSQPTENQKKGIKKIRLSTEIVWWELKTFASRTFTESTEVIIVNVLNGN